MENLAYDIADMDYWYNCGDTAFTKHHLVIVPHSQMYTHNMNATNTTQGGYTGSLMYTEGLEQAKTIIKAAFGDMLLTHREYLVNAVTNGKPSAGAWFNSDVDLMNENMVYGSHIFAPANDGITIPSNYTINTQQLAIFALNRPSLNVRQWAWLRDPVSAANFAIVRNYGFAGYDFASGVGGVRPVFPIG